MADSSAASFAQILKSSSIVGSAQGINLLLGMVRTKFAAVLIGPSGVGLLGNYLAVQNLVAIVAGLGIQSSAVRDVAAAASKGDATTVGRTILTLRRVCWLTGLIGAFVMVSLSHVISIWTFGSTEHAVEIAMLGVVILFGNIAGGQTALVQGMRRIGDLARLNVIGAAAGAAISIGLYAWLGLQGIVPALLLTASVQLAASWYFARRVHVPRVEMRWRDSIRAAGGLIQLGLVFMWTGLAGGAVLVITRALITQQISLEAVGIFGAAMSLSGMLINIVLNAMGADYYPRLTAVGNDREAINRLVNEQTEIGLLLAVPGLLATLSLAPWAIRVFYSEDFLPATELLQWFVLGCLGRVVSWPLGYVMLALAKGKAFFVSETVSNAIHLTLIAIGLYAFGLEGVAVAFFVLYLVYTAVAYGIARTLTGFTWSTGVLQLYAVLLPIVIAAFFGARLLPLLPSTIFGFLVSAAATILCMRGIAKRVGSSHRIVLAFCRLPGMRWIISH